MKEGEKEFEKIFPGSIDFFQLGEFKSELPSNLCTAIKDFKTNENQKIIGEWIKTTKNKNALDEEGNSVVHLAIVHRHPKLALWLLEKGVDINVINKKTRESALSVAIYAAANQLPGSNIRENYIALIKFLIEKKANMAVDAGFGMYKYALCMAAIYCDLEIVKLLVEQGDADVNYSKDVITPIQYASSAGGDPQEKEEIISYLKSKGAALHNAPGMGL